VGEDFGHFQSASSACLIAIHNQLLFLSIFAVPKGETLVFAGGFAGLGRPMRRARNSCLHHHVTCALRWLKATV
jgi:hypothetical protein